jgi:hypothetical protein
MKSGIACFLFIIGAIIGVSGYERQAKATTQTSNDQIEVTTDRFSKKTTLVLKPQSFIDKPDHFVTLTIKTELEKSTDPREKVSTLSSLYLFSQAKVPPDFGNSELNFLANGQPLNIKSNMIEDYPTSLASKYYTIKNNLRIKRAYTCFVFDPSFTDLSKAESVEMKLGSFELKLSQSITANLREYAKQVIEHQSKISNEGRP